MANIKRNGWLFGPSKKELEESRQKQASFYADTIRKRLEQHKYGDSYKEIGKHSAQDMVQNTWREFQSLIFAGEPYQITITEVVDIGKEQFDKIKQRLKRNPRLRVKRNAVESAPDLHKYTSEQDKARLTAAFIGHRLAPFQPVSNTMVAGCELCGSTVEVTGRKMHGLAVTTKCINTP